MNPERTPTLLVVDDNREYSRALAKIFERAGYRVCTAGDGQEALRILTDRPFDLVITDLEMPRMNGLELLRSIRAMSPHVPVLILTAFGEWTTYIEALDCGCEDYLSKSVHRDKILMAARKALARRGIRAPHASATNSAEGEGGTM
ncbi:MAG: response regulator [Candidatus Tectomicrobia bacterium]|uniref:Response regulator n=1 Tax=Tectimicrobiota bacterium TaxID=2528274 RepID=A0A932GNJ7_UNCTE|nr:response regulator [Candidatus Tectomicrobia bacterium]